MTKHSLFIFFCASLAIGCSEPSDRLNPEDGESSGDPTTTTDPTTTASTSTTMTSTTEPQPTTTTTTSDADSSGSEAESSTGEPACDGQCVAAPEGWNGPVVMGRSMDEEASCDDDAYAETALLGNVGLDAPPFTCGCSCSVSEQGACSPVSSLHAHSDPQCDDAAETIGINQGCTNIADHEPGYFRWSIETTGGACEANAQMIPTPLGWDESVVACTTDAVAEGACEDDATCVVAPTSDAPLCWWQEGDVECPVELPGSREVIYTEAPTDSRSCSACECGEPEVTCDAPGVVLVQANNACNVVDLSPPAVAAPQGECVQAGTVRSVVWEVPGEPDTDCAAAAPSMPTGSAAPQGAVTVCCAG